MSQYSNCARIEERSTVQRHCLSLASTTDALFASSRISSTLLSKQFLTNVSVPIGTPYMMKPSSKTPLTTSPPLFRPAGMPGSSVPGQAKTSVLVRCRVRPVFASTAAQNCSRAGNTTSGGPIAFRSSAPAFAIPPTALNLASSFCSSLCHPTQKYAVASFDPWVVPLEEVPHFLPPLSNPW